MNARAVSSCVTSSLRAVSGGAWAVGVSGGADSVALLLLLNLHRPDLRLHVAHLNHETRPTESEDDAEFVQELVASLDIPCTIARRSEIEPEMKNLPANLSSRFREIRRELFRRVVAEHRLDGVLLAHHADDQAETVLHRLLRGSGPAGLFGMEPRAVFERLVVLRPLLAVRRADLRAFLAAADQSWREDSSNTSDKYFRNRLRYVLKLHPNLTQTLLELSAACGDLRGWTQANAPQLPASFRPADLNGLPHVLATESARRWLRKAGATPDQVYPDVLDRLIHMAADAGSPAALNFPGNLVVRRRGGWIGT